MNIFSSITDLLNLHHVEYQIKDHLPAHTSEESALHRGEPLKIGAKALLLKTDAGFIMAVLPADRRIDSTALKKILSAKSLRFATSDELKEITGLVPGSVPPFGSLFNIPMLVDKSLLNEEYMAFNAGSLEKSIKMKVEDYIKILHPVMEDFSQLKLI